MPSNKDFALRVEILDACFRNNLRKWTLDKLVEEVNKKLDDLYGKKASKHTIQNDIKSLIRQHDAPIDKKKEGAKTYFYYLDSNFSIKNLPIKADEVALLRDVVNTLSQVSDFQIVRDVEDIIIKLQNTISIDVEKSPAIMQFEKHTTAIGTEYIDSLFTAIKSKMALRISYQSFKAPQAEECIFHPYLLKEYRNRWFVIGRKADSKMITNLALDRIKGIKNSNAEYVTNDLFETDTYFNNMIGVTIPENAAIDCIQIKVSSKQVPYIRTKPIHHTQKIIKEFKNGDIIIELSIISNYELRSVLLSYGCDIVVIKPLTLRKEMQEIFKAGANCYK